jgi:hypothetical protein
MDKSEPVVITKVWTEGEAAVIKSLFEAYEIPSHYSSELPLRFYPVSEEDEPRIRIFVPAELARDARELLDGYQQCETAPGQMDDEL